MNKISGCEYPIKKIFSEEFDFVIPPYQRPYAWTKEEAGALFDDLVDFMRSQDENEPYFLGSIVLIKGDIEPKAEVIDGQQRLTTLTILLAIISSLLEEEDSREFATYINEPGKKVEGLFAKPRVALRERDREFFKKYVQDFNFDELLSLDPITLTDVGINIRNNSELFIQKLNSEFGVNKTKVFDFGSFIVNRCYLVSVSTPTMQSAYRIFSVLNGRGMDLLASDILKADIIGKIPERLRGEYTNKWEDLEEDLGRDDFNGLLAHIRMIRLKYKAKRSILEEIQKELLPALPDSSSFIDHMLVPYSEAYDLIRHASYRSSTDPTKINETIGWLLRIDNWDWLPPSILFMTKHRNDPDKLESFFIGLERLAASLFVRGFSPTGRIERYAKVLQAIEDGTVLNTTSPLNLDQTERENTISVLSGDVYLLSKRARTYALLRLDSFISDRAAQYDYTVITVEHVLPQTVAAGSYWAQEWPDENLRRAWLHKLGNIILLSRRKNSQAQNYDFQLKKTKYFSSHAGVSSFALATQVVCKSEWTPAIVETRQKELLDACKKGWNLNDSQ